MALPLSLTHPFGKFSTLPLFAVCLLRGIFCCSWHCACVWMCYLRVIETRFVLAKTNEQQKKTYFWVVERLARSIRTSTNKQTNTTNQNAEVHSLNNKWDRKWPIFANFRQDKISFSGLSLSLWSWILTDLLYFYLLFFLSIFWIMKVNQIFWQSSSIRFSRFLLLVLVLSVFLLSICMWFSSAGKESERETALSQSICKQIQCFFSSSSSSSF